MLSSNQAIEVMVVDEHAAVLRLVSCVFNPTGDITVCAASPSFDGAVELAQSVEPDVILADVRSSDIRALDTCRVIRSRLPHTRILVLTTSSEDDALFTAVVAGASGYLLKQPGHRDLGPTVRAVARGENLLDAGAVASLAGRLRRAADESITAPPLSRHELDVLALVVLGKTNAHIAAALRTDEGSVRSDVVRIISALGAVREGRRPASATYQSPNMEPMLVEVGAAGAVRQESVSINGGARKA